MNEEYDMLEIIIRMNEAMRRSEMITKMIIQTVEESIQTLEGSTNG